MSTPKVLFRLGYVTKMRTSNVEGTGLRGEILQPIWRFPQVAVKSSVPLLILGYRSRWKARNSLFPGSRFGHGSLAVDTLDYTIQRCVNSLNYRFAEPGVQISRSLVRFGVAVGCRCRRVQVLGSPMLGTRSLDG